MVICRQYSGQDGCGSL